MVDVSDQDAMEESDGPDPVTYRDCGRCMQMHNCMVAACGDSVDKFAFVTPSFSSEVLLSIQRFRKLITMFRNEISTEPGPREGTKFDD